MPTPTGKMGGDEEERCAEEDKGHAHSSFGLDLRDDPGGDRSMLHFWAGQRKYWNYLDNLERSFDIKYEFYNRKTNS